jgi:hypothetical protein
LSLENRRLKHEPKLIRNIRVVRGCREVLLAQQFQFVPLPLVVATSRAGPAIAFQSPQQNERFRGSSPFAIAVIETTCGISMPSRSSSNPQPDLSGMFHIASIKPSELSLADVTRRRSRRLII